MIDKTTRKELAALSKNIAAVERELGRLDTAYNDLRLKVIRTVTMTKVGETVTLESGNRVIKAKKPARYNDRWNLTENGKSLAKEVFGGIHEIRFAIAMGQL